MPDLAMFVINNWCIRPETWIHSKIDWSNQKESVMPSEIVILFLISELCAGYQLQNHDRCSSTQLMSKQTNK